MTFAQALMKFAAAADWSEEQFKTAARTDPFWAEVVKHYRTAPEAPRSVVAKNNAFMRLLRQRR